MIINVNETCERGRQALPKKLSDDLCGVYVKYIREGHVTVMEDLQLLKLGLSPRQPACKVKKRSKVTAVPKTPGL